MVENLKLRPDGFHERGGEVTRIEAFVDASFAFALTMLVISVGSVPEDFHKVLEALRGMPAFAACFLQIAIFWYDHMTWSRRYGLDDAGSVVLSLVLVFLVMVYVYPLKYMFGGLFAWISHGVLSTGMTIGGIDDLRAMFVTYAILFGTMSIVMSLLYRQAWKQREALALSLDERVATLRKIGSGWVTAGLASLSFVVALLMRRDWPEWTVGAPGMVYALMFLNGVIPAWFGRRARERMLAEGVA